MLAAHENPTDGPVKTMLQDVASSFDLHVALSVDMVRGLLMGHLSQAPQLPAPFDAIRSRVPSLLSAVEVRVRVSGGMASALVAHARNEQDAQALEEIVDKSLRAGLDMMRAQMAQVPASDDPVQEAARRYGQRIGEHMIEQFRPVRQGEKLVLEGRGQSNAQVATIGILVALLLPAVNAAREAARRNVSMNKMKQLGLAMANYESAQGHYPARASFDADGKPLLSYSSTSSSRASISPGRAERSAAAVGSW